MTVITLPYTDETRAGLLATALFASKNDMTPVIHNVNLYPTGVVATDRYGVGRFAYDKAVPIDYDGEPILLPAADLTKWIKALDLPRLHGQPTVLRFTLSELTVRAELVYGEADSAVTRSPIVSATWEAPKGNYPSVGRLFPDELAETMIPMHLSEMLLSRTAAAMELFKLREPRLSFNQSKTTADQESRRKPGTILVEVIGINTGRFDALLQPNLVLNR